MAKRRYSYEERHRTVNGVKQKRCSKCGKWKSESEFHRNGSSKDGLGRQCKECVNRHYERNRKAGRRYLRYEERHRVVDGVEQKRCSTCRRWKAVSEFYESERTRPDLAQSIPIEKGCKHSIHSPSS